MMTYAVGVDIGGTFTDCVVTGGGGEVILAKAFSTPPDFSAGIVDAVTRAATDLGLSLGELLRDTPLFLHSTTVAENAVVGGSLARAGILTNRGFEDTLYTMRGGYGRWSGLSDDEKRNPVATDKPEPLIPPSLVKGIQGRVDFTGRAVAPPDPDEIRRVVQELYDQGVEALGVCLLWSFMNPEQEGTVRRIIEEMCPDLFVTCSWEISPTTGEYERTSTTALNARLGPVVRGYLAGLRETLEREGFDGTLLVMQAYGGLLPVDKAVTRPVGLIESGPVSGVVGCRDIGLGMGFTDIIAADMGGTTFKVGVVRDGLIQHQRDSMVLRYHYALPKMDVVSLGLAGGSVISVDPRTGVPHIGPRSAGSYPGPVCYGHGGNEPTITDMDLILGYLNPSFFVGGREALAVEAAWEVATEKVAKPLGMPLEEAAAAMYRLANSMLYDLLHKTTVQRGLDPRRFVLFSFGGTAGMHVSAYARALGVSKVVIPYSASVHGAFGLITSDVVHEEHVARPMRAPVGPGALREIFGSLRERVGSQLEREGFGASDIRMERFVGMRYARQVHILQVPFPETEGEITEGACTRLLARFEHLYEERYGPESAYRAAGVELTTFSLRGSGAVRKPDIQPRAFAGTDPSAAFVETRTAWVEEDGQFRDVAGYSLDKLGAGNEVHGPVVIWSPITTVVLGLNEFARVDEHLNLVVERG